jgi:AcrR family transcriptional regulator
MPKPRFKRRKENRPAEITEAAFHAFAENGYEATRVDDVAKRAGVSKGLLYLYFKTKEELFKAVVKSFITPRIDALRSRVESSALTAEEFLRGPFLDFAKQIPKSPVKILIRLMVAEGHRHPELVAYYWENVVSQGLAALGQVIDKGVRDGEFKSTAIAEFPHLIVAPVMLSIIWSIIFSTRPLDTDRMFETHVDTILAAIRIDNQSARTV